MIRPFVIASCIVCLAACAAVPPEIDAYSAHDSAEIQAEGRQPESIPALAAPTAPASAEQSAARGPSEPAFSLMDSELQTQGGWAVPVAQEPGRKGHPQWRPGQALMQGFFGAMFMDQVDIDTGSNTTIQNEGQTILPVIGGGAQWKLSGEKVDFGVEAMFSVGWQANATAVAIGGGGAAVAVDFGLTLIDIYGGPFLSMFLGDKTRVYIAAGPLLEWANYDPDTVSGGASANGFGAGGYARTGIEFLMGSGTLIGFGARWAKSSVSLSNGYGNMDLEGLQAVLTVTRGF
jgi:hypothetical protein